MQKKYCFLLCVLLIPMISFGQDPHFSQFFASPLTLNPANTGNFNGEFRANSNFRNQWPSINQAYRTFTLSMDAPVLASKLGPYNRMGIGMVAMSDQSGNGLLTENDLALSVAYRMSLDDEGYSSLSGGLQASYINYRFNPAQAYFEDQLTVDGFVLPSSELLLGRNLSKSFADFHAGLIYTISTTDFNLFYIGSSYFHSFSPAMQFNDQQNNLSPRLNIHGGGYWPISNNATFHASFQFQQKQNQSELLFGGVYSYFVQASPKTSLELYLGSWFRLKDAWIPYLGLEYNQWMLGLSYDINMTRKTESQYFRTGELSLQYTFKQFANGRPVKCPTF